MKIALCQHPGVAGRKAEALAAMEAAARAAAAQGARLIVFPEMFLTGYAVAGAELARLAETADGPAAARAAGIAEAAGIALLYGYPEREGERIFNAARLIDRRGRTLAAYRKTHLYGEGEKRRFAPGARLAAAELEGLTIGILICYDVEFPEAVRALALAGCALVAVPTALLAPDDIVARTLVPARAFENQLYVAYAGLCGSEGETAYCGLSTVVAPDGRELARAGGGPELICAEIDPAAIPRSRAANPYLADRRPKLYAAPVARG
jgi:predicted amidohydrolase